MNYRELSKQVLDEQIEIAYEQYDQKTIKAIRKIFAERQTARRQAVTRAMKILMPTGKGRNAFHRHLQVVKALDAGMPVSGWHTVRLTDEEKAFWLAHWKQEHGAI
ncbi:MAG: hypothetical protein MOB07_31130 [Acidobacteria bacterium]|nr:hypothetical protein [Acidobacteriota bacterium]